MSGETISTCFPPTIRVLEDYTPGFLSSTVVEPYADGLSSQRRFRGGPKLTLSLTTEWLTRSNLQVARDFLLSLKGETIPFYLFLLDKKEIWVKEPIGTSTAGPGQVLPLVFRETAVSQLYVDGVSLAGAFTVNVNAGTYGEDSAVITGTQTAGKPVTADLTGRKRFGIRLTAGGFQWQVVPKTASSRFIIRFAAQEV